MCGICGVWNEKNVPLVEDMLDVLSHRGPDDRGFHIDHNGVLGHARLSIMDPAGGRQPIYGEERRTAVIANGEIYNFPQLYESLKRSHTFSTRNDSEALVHLYEDKGPDMVRHIDGMYAFCIADGQDIFIVRDPIGIKPLYFCRAADGRLAFGSEWKSMVGLPGEVNEFPPGTWYHSRRGFNRFYEIPRLEAEEADGGRYVELLKEVLERSIVKRLMSDVPLGSFLSGGLDSSIISAVVRRNISELHTFSVGLSGSEDLPAARVVADHIGSTHHEYILTEREILQKLPEIIYYLESFDQDLIRSAIPCYFTSRLASDYVKVILTGEGADELFGGYDYYKTITDPGHLNAELRRSIANLHNINLQRVDRLTMAHSLEARVPFLDLDMIELAQRIPSGLKLRSRTPGDRAPVEKWILRRAFETALPDEIVWRDKKQFDEGTGVSTLMQGAVDSILPDDQALTHIFRNPDVLLRSKEEVYYHMVFRSLFSHAPEITRSMGRWGVRPAYN